VEMTSFLDSEIKHVKAKKIALGIIVAVIIITAFVVDRYINADRVYYLAVHQQEEGNVVEAKKGYEDALHMNPWHADANYQLGILLSREGKTSEAVKLIQRALQLKDEPDYYVGLGHLYLNKLKDASRAEASFRKAYDLDPKNYYACSMLGNLAERRHNNDKAIQYYEQAIRLDPQLTACYKNLAAIYDAKGMTGKAGEYWRDVLRINPKDEDAKAYFKVGKSAN